MNLRLLFGVAFFFLGAFDNLFSCIPGRESTLSLSKGCVKHFLCKSLRHLQPKP